MTLFGNKMHYYEEHKNWDSLYPHLTRNSRPIWGGHFLQGWLKWIRCSLWPRGIYNLVEAKQRQAWSIIPLWAGQWGPRADVLTGPLPVDCVYFPGLLKPGTFSREELVDVLRAAVVDRKGEGWEGQVPRDPEGEASSPEPSEDLVRYFTKTCGVTSWFSHSRTSLAATSHVLSLPQHHGMQLWRGRV